MTVLEMLQTRDALMQCIRAFFFAEGFTEVETPIGLKTPCMELHIDAVPFGDGFLRTSPELSHKKLLACGAEKIFEIGKCFRQGEQGPLHHPEYTLLEWYRVGSDYRTALKDTQNLFSAILEHSRDAPAAFSKTWKVCRVGEVFEELAGWNPEENFEADRFDLDLIEKIEPALPKDRPVVLKDYPAECCALARLKPGQPKIAERWELYLGGVEIANAYSELTDSVEQRARFEKWGNQRTRLGKPTYPLDEDFIQCLDQIPPTSGVALGLDRLLMILTGEKNLAAVLPLFSSGSGTTKK